MEFIGEGGIWTVMKLASHQEIFRTPKGFSNSKIESFVNNHRIIKQLGLPTLKRVEKRVIDAVEGIISENLNASENQIYVSPNSLYSDSHKLVYHLSKDMLNHPERRISVAEEFRYRNKIEEVINFESFLANVKLDLLHATQKKVLIEFDGYFFGSKKYEKITTLEYIIADLDHILITEDLAFSKLMERNLSEFSRAMFCFIKYFVRAPNDDKYREQLHVLI